MQYQDFLGPDYETRCEVVQRRSIAVVTCPIYGRQIFSLFAKTSRVATIPSNHLAQNTALSRNL